MGSMTGESSTVLLRGLFLCLSISLCSSTALKVARSLLATASPRVVDTVAEATEVVERKLVAMGVAEATNSHPSMEEATTTRRRATALPLHRASASRAITVKVELNLSCVWISFGYNPSLKFC